MLSRRELNLTNSPELKKAIERPIKVDRSYDIPYVAGYSEDGKTVYVDRHFNSKMGGVDVEKFVVTHEHAEKSAIDLFDLHYKSAHKIATQIEKQRVEEAEIDWKKYEKFVMDQYKEIGHEELKKVPKDLDLTPYSDSKDFKLLKKIKDVSDDDGKGSH